MARTPVQHVGHHAHRLLVWLGGIAALLILVAAVGMWRLMQGPIELDRLIPYVQQALSRSGAGLGVAVSGVSIALDRETHQLDLRASDVSLALPSGEKIANFPEMATSFSLGALLRGRIEPTRVTIAHPVLLLTRETSGAFTFRVGSADGGDLDDPLAIFAPLRDDAPWRGLRQIVIRDATVVVDDRVTDHVWQAKRVAATVQRDENGSGGDASLAVEFGGTAPELHATYHYAAARQRLDLALTVDGLEPAALAAFAPASLAPLGMVKTPVSGTLDLRFDLAANALEGGRVDLDFGEGRIETPLLAGGGLPFASGALHADYAPEKSELRLERLALDLGGGSRLVAAGNLGGLAPRLVSAGAAWPESLAGSLEVTLSHVPAGRVPSLWPQGVSPGGRRWVAANLPEGMLDELAFGFAVAVDPVAKSAAFSSARGTMRFHDLTVDYLTGLPPAKNVSGTATLDEHRLDFAVTGGAVRSLKSSGGTVAISDLGSRVETLTVDVGLAGPLQDALEAIDAKPLHYARDAGLDPARAGGKVDAQLHFRLPLLADLRLDQVDYGAKATFTGVSLGKIALGRDLRDGAFTMELGHAGVHVQGSGRFDGSPATVDGNLYFHPASGPRARYRIGVSLDAAARQRLGWDDGGRLAGTVAADLTYTTPPSGAKATLDAVLDLAGARLALAEAGWEKPPQAPGTVRLAAELDNDVVTGVPQIAVKAPGLDGQFALTLGANGERVQRLDITHLAIGEDDLTGAVSRRPDGGWRADIRAAHLNLHRVLKKILEDDGPAAGPPLQIDAKVAHLALGPSASRELQGVTAALVRDVNGWQSVRIDGAYPIGGRLGVHLAPAADGTRRLHVESDNFGAGLRLFGIADNVVGGKVTVAGTVIDSGGHQLVRAHVDGQDYSLVRAPALARLLSLTSFDGVLGMMSGSGIPFMTLRGDLTFSQGRVTFDPVLGYGGALGITAKGWLNPGEDQIDIDGTLAPAYALNSIIGNLPLIGSLIAGGEGQGLFAASFRLTGSNDDPTVTVNPLSALTPGMLRHLFDPIVGTSAPPTQEARHP